MDGRMAEAQRRFTEAQMRLAEAERLERDMLRALRLSMSEDGADIVIDQEELRKACKRLYGDEALSESIKRTKLLSDEEEAT
eukprot:31755-Eustigmatos_ZCMA.PRE.1